MIGLPDSSLSNELEKLARLPEDPKDLIYNSCRAAQLRMIWDYSHKKGYDPIDSLIIFGDPTEGVSVSSDLEEMTRQFLERGKKKKEQMERLDPILRRRHEEYLNAGRYKAVLEGMKFAA